MDYKTSFFISFLLSFFLTPIFRYIAIKLSILDYPITNIKTHKKPVPYLGGLSIALSFFITLFLIRITTQFPTGTLRYFRAIVFAGFVIMLVGLLDDVKYGGLHFSRKFLGEIIAAVMLISYGIKIKFITPDWFAVIFTLIWIIGITNAFNIIDVMDGLSSGVGIIASFFFFIIGSTLEEEIYVNFTSLVLAGACLGFLPYNLSGKFKIFMGDAGSLFIGIMLSVIALGTKYSLKNIIGVIAPIIILLIPIYDTLLVSIIRMKKGKSPFLGSKDHFALRLENIGLNRKKILILSYVAGIILGLFGFIITQVSLKISIIILFILVIIISKISNFLLKVDVD